MPAPDPHTSSDPPETAPLETRAQLVTRPPPGSPGPSGPRDPLVIFMPSGKRGRFPVGTPLLQAGRTLGVDIDSVCGGRGLCGRCQIQVAVGEFAKHGVSSSESSLSPFSE